MAGYDYRQGICPLCNKERGSIFYLKRADQEMCQSCYIRYYAPKHKCSFCGSEEAAREIDRATGVVYCESCYSKKRYQEYKDVINRGKQEMSQEKNDKIQTSDSGVVILDKNPLNGEPAGNDIKKPKKICMLETNDTTLEIYVKREIKRICIFLDE